MGGINRKQMDLSVTELVTRVIKYLLEGLAVAIAMVIIPRKIPTLEEIVSVALVAAVVFAILDLLSPSVGLTARQGAGFGLGANMVGFPGGAAAGIA
jgi:ABC-type Co2+ transport system permease subunit